MSLLMQKIGSIALILVLCSQSAFAALQYRDRELTMKDFEEMQRLLFKIRAQKVLTEDPDEARTLKLREAVKALFARRDIDGARSKLYVKLAGDLQEEEEVVMSDITDEALSALKITDLGDADHSTYLQILENMLSELRPKAGKSMKEVFERIRDAKIEPNDGVKKYRRLKGMAETISPSVLAENIVGPSTKK